MILEEAKKLKPGDRILVEVEVTYYARGEYTPSHMSPHNNVAVKVALLGAHDAAFWIVSPGSIIEKLPEPRRTGRR